MDGPSEQLMAQEPLLTTGLSQTRGHVRVQLFKNSLDIRNMIIEDTDAVMRMRHRAANVLSHPNPQMAPGSVLRAMSPVGGQSENVRSLSETYGL